MKNTKTLDLTKPVQTKSGIPIEITEIKLTPGYDYPVRGRALDNSVGFHPCWTVAGVYNLSGGHPENDLINVPEPAKPLPYDPVTLTSWTRDGRKVRIINTNYKSRSDSPSEKCWVIEGIIEGYDSRHVWKADGAWYPYITDYQEGHPRDLTNIPPVKKVEAPQGSAAPARTFDWSKPFVSGINKYPAVFLRIDNSKSEPYRVNVTTECGRVSERGFMADGSWVKGRVSPVFDLQNVSESAKLDWTKPIQTRAGLKAVLTTDNFFSERVEQKYNHLVLVDNVDGTKSSWCFTPEGRYDTDVLNHDRDIINVPVKPEVITGFVNVWKRFKNDGTVEIFSTRVQETPGRCYAVAERFMEQNRGRFIRTKQDFLGTFPVSFDLSKALNK